MSNSNSPAEKVTVIIEVENHEHAETRVAKGDRIEVSPRAAERLATKKIGRLATAAETKKGPQ